VTEDREPYESYEALARGPMEGTGYFNCPVCTYMKQARGPDVQILLDRRHSLSRPPGSGMVTAVTRKHMPVDLDPARARAEELLVLYAEKHRLPGMLDGRPAQGLYSHWRACWVPINNLAIPTFPHELAGMMAYETQQAVEWFHDRSHVLVGDSTVRSIPDDEVDERIAGMQYAIDKEVMRIDHGGVISDYVDPETMVGYGTFHDWYGAAAGEEGATLRYDLAAMPRERQRALVERWERAHLDFLAAHQDIGYDRDYGYLRRPFRVFDRPPVVKQTPTVSMWPDAARWTIYGTGDLEY
jgi:hypothetical protein